jgi:hypothetical protein
MDDVVDIIIDRLLDEQSDATQQHSCIMAMFETIAKESVRNCRQLNNRMQSLGWDDFELDEHTFKLVMLVLGRTGHGNMLNSDISR